MLETFLFIMPSIVGVLYFITAILYLIKGDIPWAIVWASYALANLGLVLVGFRS